MSTSAIAAPPKKGFDWSHFLLTLAQIAPALVIGSMQLASEAGSAPNMQTASDSLHLLSGAAQALASNDPAIVKAAQNASSLIDATITAIAEHHSADTTSVALHK